MDFYQKEHCIFDNYFVMEHKANFSFPRHLHRSFEFIIILDGEMEVTVDRVSRVLRKNDCAFIFPNQIHSLKSTCSEHILFIFSPETIANFVTMVNDREPDTNFFTMENVNLISQIKAFSEKNNNFKIKGILYSVCGEYFDRCSFLKTSPKSDSNITLLKTLLQYIESNYTGECSLTAIASELHYNYSYLSRMFAKETGVSFNAYLNQLRINKACFMLIDEKRSILDIALECGYDNVRSFHRNFVKQQGMTPTEYREKKTNSVLI